MKLRKIKKIFLSFLLVATLISQVLFGVLFVQPKQAQAVFGVGDFTFNTEIWNPYDIAKEVTKAILVRTAVNYSNEYLTRFVNKAVDKYKIRNFLYYDRVLSDFYLNRFISDKIDDPELRQIYQLLEGIYLTGNAPGLTAAQRREALIPQLKNAVYQHYLDQGGIPTETVFRPPANLSAIDYYSLSYAYYLNPPSFTEQNLRGSFGAFQSSATTAAQLEVLVGNGLKAGRVIGGTCNLDPNGLVTVDSVDVSGPGTDDLDLEEVEGDAKQNELARIRGLDGVPKTLQACESAGGEWQPSAIDQARGFIDNPTLFVEGQLRGALDNVWKTNFDPNNPFAAIGSLLGDFIFKKLQLNNSGSSGIDVLDDGGDFYTPNTGSEARFSEFDLDEDGFPEGYITITGPNGGQVVACYHGIRDSEIDPGDETRCVESSKTGNSPYFSPLCQSIDRAINELTEYLRFADKYKTQFKSNGVDFKDQADSGVWVTRTQLPKSSIADLLNSVRNYKIEQFDDFEIVVNRYSFGIDTVFESLIKDKDLDLNTGFGVDADSGVQGRIGGLIQSTTRILQYLIDVRAAGLLNNRCDNPDVDAIDAVPEPDIIIVTPDDDGGGGGGTGVCKDPGSTVANYADELQSAIDDVNSRNPGGVADQLNFEAEALAYLAEVAAALGNLFGLNASTDVLNGNDNPNSGDLIAIWASGETVVERYDAVVNVGLGDQTMRQAASAGQFTGDIPIGCQGTGGGPPTGGGGGGDGQGNDPGAPATVSLSDVVWIDQDVSGWAVTVTDLNVSIGSDINLSHSGGTDVWRPEIDGVVGNAWIFVWRRGQWYGGTWEYLRPNQRIKGKDNLQSPGVIGKLESEKELTNFVAQPGETYGFMVSGLARDTYSNVQERSNIDMATWQ
jgi:hypothetical protein